MRIHRPRRLRSRRALSLPEVLISLAITALLLTAVAAAFTASASAIEVNDRFFRASQAARISLAQILALVRRCESCNIPGYAAPATSCSGTSINIIYKDEITGTDHVDALFQFSGSPSNQLQLVLNGVTTPLAHNVKAVTFSADMAQISNLWTPVNITVDITIQINEETVHIRGSAAPRQVYYSQF